MGMTEIKIARWSDLTDRTNLTAALDRIFFEASGTKVFDGEKQRAAFRERWLGRYLRDDPDFCFVAFVDDTVAGYVCGSLDDPARAPRFADLGYFADFVGLTKNYPAHLHVNVAATHRGRRIGGRLVSAFADAVRAAGVPGVHVVTERGARNVAFYERNDFHEAGATQWNGRVLVFLCRNLDAR